MNELINIYVSYKPVFVLVKYSVVTVNKRLPWKTVVWGRLNIHRLMTINYFSTISLITPTDCTTYKAGKRMVHDCDIKHNNTQDAIVTQLLILTSPRCFHEKDSKYHFFITEFFSNSKSNQELKQSFKTGNLMHVRLV